MKAIEELKKLSKEELIEALEKEREKVRELRFRAASRDLKTVHEIGLAKQKVARILTVLKNNGVK